MKHLIDKDALVAEIERRIVELSQLKKASYEIGLFDAYKIILSFLDTFEVKEVQEQKEELTDKERIREEIERLHEEYRGKKGDADVRRALRTVIFFIDCMQ